LRDEQSRFRAVVCDLAARLRGCERDRGFHQLWRRPELAGDLRSPNADSVRVPNRCAHLPRIAAPMCSPKLLDHV
jgi:hypothetical protein